MDVEIQCVACDESGSVDGEICSECNGTGRFSLRDCPREFVGQEITKAINIASLCGNGILPVNGGLMDQSAWFLSVWQQLQSEQSKIDAEEAERLRSG